MGLSFLLGALLMDLMNSSGSAELDINRGRSPFVYVSTHACGCLSCEYTGGV